MENKNWTIDGNKLFELILEDINIDSSAFSRVKKYMDNATVEVVHGDWWGVGDMLMCTVCHEQVYTYSNYCPNCGARMDGDEDE